MAQNKPFSLRRMVDLRVNNANGDFGATGALEQIITTQTEIVSGVISQKFYELHGQKPSDFVPFDVGRGAYSTNLFQYKAAYVGSPFKSGLISVADGLGQNAKSSIKIDGITIYNNFWRMDYEVSHEQMQQALRNPEAFSIIEENEKARKRIYDLGIQDLIFNGLGDGRSYGINNAPNVNITVHKFRLIGLRSEVISNRNYSSSPTL